MTAVRTISRDELTTRAWAARVNIEPGGDDGMACAVIGGVMYVAPVRDGGAA